MLLTVGIKVFLWVAGLLWCKEVVERRHDDLDVLRTGDDRMHQGLIVGFWIATALIALGLGWMVVDTAGKIVRGVRGF